MTPRARKILSFGLLLLPLFLVFLALYVWIWDFYHPIATESANLVTKHLSPPSYLELNTGPKGGWKAYVFTPKTGLDKLRSWYSPTAHLIYLSFVILPALLLATPAPFLARLRMLAISIPLMYLSHVFSLICLTRTTMCLLDAPGTFSCLWLLRFTYSSGQMFAGVFWVLLTWRHWYAALMPPASVSAGDARG
jgi:hypothetical protein